MHSTSAGERECLNFSVLDTEKQIIPFKGGLRRGRKRKYGQRVDAAALDALPVQQTELTLYGKAQWVRVRSTLAVARFLKALPVRAVWCEMRQPDHTWSRPRLILATETDLSAQAVVEIYACLLYTSPSPRD